MGLLLLVPCYCWHSGVATVSEVPFELAVAGGPAVDWVAGIPADPGVPILAGGFTFWTVQ